MTYEVARNVISNLFEDAIPMDEIEESKRIAIECIEKQIPASPKASIGGLRFTELTYECPCCENDIDNPEWWYCPWCGQRID